MWFSERYTFNRGLSDVPATFLRIRSCTRLRVWFLEIFVSIIRLSAFSRQRTTYYSSLVGQVLRFARDDAREVQTPRAAASFRSRLAHFLLQTLSDVTHAL